MPKANKTPIKETWPKLTKGEIKITNNQYIVEVAWLIILNPLLEHELKGHLQY